MANYEQMIEQIPVLNRWMPAYFKGWMNANTPSPIVDYWWKEYQKSWAARLEEPEAEAEEIP